MYSTRVHTKSTRVQSNSIFEGTTAIQTMYIPSAPLLRWCSWVPAASAAPEATEDAFFDVLLELSSFSLRFTERFCEFCTFGTWEPCPPMSRFNSKPCSSSVGWGRALTTFGLRCNFRCCIHGLLPSPSTSLLLSLRVSAVNDKQEGWSHWTGLYAQ